MCACVAQGGVVGGGYAGFTSDINRLVLGASHAALRVSFRVGSEPLGAVVRVAGVTGAIYPLLLSRSVDFTYVLH